MIRLMCSNGFVNPKTNEVEKINSKETELQTNKKRFYFNTGVRPENVINPPFPYEYHRKKGNVIHGTLCIPFDCCNVPDNAKFEFACDNPNLRDNNNGYIVREIVGGNMISKYAYFRIPE